ncbi:MAG: 6-phosphogluconolactonase [Saprospiraceae bacterium]|nr:6-phosphogluconolactonase [Saprospiraceae bacterium]
MKKHIQIFNNTAELSQYFAALLVNGLENTPEGRFFSIALSGGSTPKTVFDYLANFYRDKIAWHKVKVFWSDERCVPPDSSESNYRMAKESLLDRVPIPASQVFRIQGEADPVKEAIRYVEIARQNLFVREGIPVFDLLMLGLGDDGHTASIFPHNRHLFYSESPFEVADHPLSGQKRITVTGNTINHAEAVVFIATGATKAEMVANVIKKRMGWEQLPAALVNPESGSLFWLLDERAAAEL